MSKLGTTRPTARITHWRDGESYAEWERLTGELQAAAADTRLVSRRSELAKAVTDLEAKRDATGVEFVIQGLPAKRWAELEAENPPRDGSSTDMELSVDVAAITDAAMSEPGTIVSVTDMATGEPIDFTGDDWPAEAEQMTAGQLGEFALKVLEVNRGRASVPKSKLASLATREFSQS